MKKVNVLTIALIIGAAVAISGCKKGKSCEELATDVANAASAFANEPTSSEKCNAYKDALNAYFDGCDEIPDATKTAYESALDALTCGD